MRKTVIALFLCILTIIFSSCSPNIKTDNEQPAENTTVNTANLDAADTSAIQIEPTAEPEPVIDVPAEVTVDEQVLIDKSGIVVTLKSLDMDSMFGPSLKVLVENNSVTSVTVQVRDCSINGIMTDCIFSSNVAPGKKANDDITFMSSTLEKAGIDTIQTVELKFHVFNSDTWNTIFDSETVTITTSAESAEQAVDDSGFVALDEKGFKIVVKKVDSENSFWGADVYVYIENNTDKSATVQLRDVSINGFMMNPIFSCKVAAGKKAFDTITFLQSDLEENDIDTIEEMECSFHIFETDGWDTIFDSEPVTITFS